MLTTTSHLTQRQLNKLKQLIMQCKRVDKSTPNIYMHLLSQPRAYPASLLYMHKQQLLGFLSAYFFYEDACEVAVMVDPRARKKGIANKLIQSVLPLVRSQGIVRLIFSCPGEANLDWLKARGFVFDHREYHMERLKLDEIIEKNEANLTFCNAKPEFIKEFCALDQLCFPKEHGENPTQYDNLLDNPEEYELIAAFKDNKLIGKAHLRYTNKGATFSDIAIHPDLQGQGLGSHLLAHTVNVAIRRGKKQLGLDVEAINTRALNLYTRLGFTIQNTCDYWAIPVAEL